uniref:Otogelin n=1 Tax=Oncorhynchus kisutch TaxID=8019 RepID=A0A8C7GE24_ONCKI
CSFPCLNGGQCVHPESCDCSLYQATGTRCQTVPNPGFEREMACRSWGQYNYESFDGLYYHFPGRCTYTLLRDCEDTSQVHNDPDCRSSPYSCTRSVSLFLPWEGEIRLHRSKVTFKGQSVQLPHHIHDVELEKISRYVLVTQQHGFTLAWDGHSGSVYIKLSPEWVGRTCGLCGNFNADVQDDLKTSYGKNRESENMEEVCAMLLEEPFTGCHEFVSPLSYMASCSNDLSMPCPPGLQYKECITCCPVSCNVDRMCIDNKLQCLDGCYCPDGETYAPVCSVTGTCSSTRFDGRGSPSQLPCQYVLAKSRNSGKFTVTIQNTPCGPLLYTSSNFVLPPPSPFNHIPIVSPEVFHIQELSSMYLQVRTALGLHLQYSWREFRLYLQVDELWKGDTVGLCGTFNGNIQDDFLSPSGMIESTPHLFGNAWRVSSACVPSQSVPQLDPCDTHQQAASYASEMCDILNQELFSACHEYLSPVPFHQQCKADTCKCGQPCLCSSLAHYARQCRKYSVITDIYPSPVEVTCPDTMEYGTCVSSCQRRCSALSTQQHCGEECEEGCVCPHGTFYSTHTHTCVPRSSCPCSFLGADYAPGDVIMTSAALNDIYLLLVPSLVPDQQCPLGQMYLDCTEGLEGLKAIDGISLGRGLGCEHTCESHLLNLTCSAHEPCIPGCVCPPGLLKHGDECFEPDACPCLWKGKEYYPGDRVTSPCHQCVCQHGTFQCVFRPCPSMCTAYGDRHYRTFDGLLFDYVGVCKVYLVKSSADLMMSVTAENVDCYDSGVICRKSLLINIGRSFIAFDDDSGKPVSVFIWSAGLFTVVHVPEEDLTVLWDRKTTVHIQAGPRWQGKLSGLCGNFDLRTVNEMRTPENIDSATPQEFGNSWTACVNSPDIRHPCSLNPLREPFSKRQCGVLLSEVFLVCHPVVDVTWFYMNCLADTCGCSRGGDCECFCTSVAAYAHRCCHQGVTVDWRSPVPLLCLVVLGKGPYRLVTYRERDTVLAANRSSGTVFPKKGEPAAAGFLSLFMMTPGLNTSLVSFEASDRPNYFLAVDSSGHLTLTKWEESEAFWAAATFTLHHDTWIQGYDSLEALARPGFFLHYMLSWIHLMKYKHTDGFHDSQPGEVQRDTPTGPKCQWRYESCVSPCFRTCSDPSGEACGTIPKVEGCLPLCPGHMVLDEVTQRCVHVEDLTTVPPLPGVHTTTIPPVPGVQVTTAISPVTIRPLTETTSLPPDTGRVEVLSTTSTTTTQEPTSSCGQLVRFNMSQNCLYNSTPPNCGLLGFAILVNGDKCCPQWDCPCRCSVFPDLNVITFDGNSVAIYKATSYIVTQLPSETVSILLWNFTNLCLVVLNITHKSNHLVINRLQRRVSLFKKFGFEILDTGNMYLIRTPAGLKLQWFHSTGMLVIETESYNSKLPTMGLCGCCDGNPANDLMLSNGTTVGESEDPAVFIDSWQVPNTTSYISHSRRREVNCSTSDCSQCMTMLKRCCISCHVPQVPPSTFCEVWVRDSEYVNNPCVALAAYVASCHKFNVCMEWRSPDYCPFMCPDRLRYQACLPTCTAQSCSNHDFDHDPEQCTGLTEGCVCPEGTLLHRPYSALCIPPEKCACTDSSGVPRAPGEVWKASKDGCCMYRCDNDSIVPVEYNCSAVSQPLCRRAGEVVISLADDTSCCPQKACGKKLAHYYKCDPERCESDVPACREDQTLIATRADGSCCLAHICMCGSCLEMVPNCQDGEVLTVDANSTDLCCPVYHCVCEPYRCAELSCPLGMSAVTVSPPDHCCPLHTCECACDKLSKPKCVLVGFCMIPHDNGCVHVISVVDAVCVDGERGVMHPGQTLVDHSQEGVCLTTQCSHSLDPTTGFHLLRTATTNCSAQCQPVSQLIYIPPKDQMMCCGVCRNISCLYHNDNGTTLLYKVQYSNGSPSGQARRTVILYGVDQLRTVLNAIFGVVGRIRIFTFSITSTLLHFLLLGFFLQVNIVSCDGKCPSASIYNYNINTYARFCKCCREMGLQRRSVQLYCSGNSTWVNYSIQEPTDCSCQWS